MSSHVNSLQELKLTSLSIEAIGELPTLGAAPTLKVLSLTDSQSAARDDSFYTIVGAIAQWICTCTSLRRLELRRFVNDTVLLSQVLIDERIRLNTLSVAGYMMSGARHFHQALACQPSLEYLYLKGEGSEIPEDNEILVQALCQLNQLRELELKDISDWFTPDHVMVLTPSLPRLERLWISGEAFDDDIWNLFLCLPNLQSLVINALSEFTTAGILDFISQLGPGNRGLNLAILNAMTSSEITEESQAIIRDALRETLNGTFDFVLARGKYLHPIRFLGIQRVQKLTRITTEEYSDVESGDGSD